MQRKLPIRLNNAPLVDAVCEMRVQSDVDLHTVLAGVFFTGLKGVSKVEQLPGMQIPEVIRARNPALAVTGSQLIQLDWGDNLIVLGTRNVLVSSKLPYKGWTQYKARVLEVFELVFASSLVKSVERYSIKYTNILSATDEREQHAKLNWALRLGTTQLSSEPTHLRVELSGKGYTTILQVATGVVAEISSLKETRHGTLVDVDTLSTGDLGPVDIFRRELPDRLEQIRLHAKKTFFDLLTDAAIERMEPVYD